MRIGVTLPQFRASADDAIAAARAVDADPKVDGVFVFDHLWAIGQPDRPALSCWPLLGTLAHHTDRVVLGTLVARVSLLPDAMLANHVEAMVRILGPDRFIAGLGAGDKLSKPENEAYGIPFPPLDARLDRLRSCVRRSVDAGATVWVGGLSERVAHLAREEGVPLNLWGVDAGRVQHAAATGEVTWGGVVNDYPGNPADLLRSLREAGATWAVLAPQYKPGEPPDRALNSISEAVAAA
ncbi:MAG TPA: LLM class flavin-dependent oxidoreductase [Acidimicrobiales bacterium]|nr:LLM class flavin-dependent oxidoreductase [Acidimicrobiales bacterium]